MLLTLFVSPTAYSTLSGFGVSSGPTHPPNVTHIVDVRYRVDISNAVPNGGDHLSRTIGYSTVVIMVTNEDITRYFVLVSTLFYFLVLRHNDWRVSLLFP